MQWLAGVTIAVSGLLFGGAVWLAVSVLTLLRSLEETEEAASAERRSAA